MPGVDSEADPPVVSEDEVEEGQEPVDEGAEDAWTITITDPTAEELDFNQSRIHILQNLECLTQIQVVYSSCCFRLIVYNSHCVKFCFAVVSSPCSIESIWWPGFQFCGLSTCLVVCLWHQFSCAQVLKLR